MNRSLTTALLRSFLLTALLVSTLLKMAYAGGVHDIPLTSILLARTPIVIDGNLADWPDTHAITVVPIDPGLVKSGSVALEQLRHFQDSATLQASYDSKALYWGITWKGLSPASNVGTVEFHIKTDRIAHIRIVPATASGQRSIQERFDTEPNWRPVAGALCAVAPHSNGTTIQEIRIPWSDVSRSGTAPASLTLAADLEWPNLTQEFLKQLPTEALHANTHLTACFLTSAEKLLGRRCVPGQPGRVGHPEVCRPAAGEHHTGLRPRHRRDRNLRLPSSGSAAVERSVDRVESGAVSVRGLRARLPRRPLQRKDRRGVRC